MDKELLIGIIGVVGTLLGTLLGFLLNYFSNKGKFKLIVKSKIIKAELNNNRETTNKFLSVESELIISNTTNTGKIIIEPFFELRNRNEIKQYIAIEKVFKNVRTFDELKNQYKNAELQYIISPKESYYLILSSQRNGQDFTLTDKTKVYFCYTNWEGKIKRIKVFNKIITSKNEDATNETKV